MSTQDSTRTAQKLVIHHLDAHYRGATSSWAGGETTNLIMLSETPRACGITTKAWSKNGKWSGQNLTRDVNVSPNWLDDVQANSLSIADGLLTTHAELVDTVSGIQVFRAAWIRQGRGLAIRAEWGMIARHIDSRTTYHVPARSSNPDDAWFTSTKPAIAGLRRKMTMQAIPFTVREERKRHAANTRLERTAKQTTKLVDLLTRWNLDEIGHVRVTRADSIRAGNCIPGTDSFIDRFFPERRSNSSATIAEIASQIGPIIPNELTGDKLGLVRQIGAACLQAIRRDRQARKAIGATP